MKAKAKGWANSEERKGEKQVRHIRKKGKRRVKAIEKKKNLRAEKKREEREEKRVKGCKMQRFLLSLIAFSL